MLNFPNRCRSFEPRQDRVRFWGYDSALEITFFLDGATLREMTTGPMSDEAEILKAFDSEMDRIHELARTAYGNDRERSHTFVLTTSAL